MLRSFYKNVLFLLAYLVAWALVKLYSLTCRIEVKGPLLDYLNEDRPVLLTWWHQDMLFNFYYLIQFAKRRKIATIISQSEDGELAAYLVKKFGIIPVRGSSSKGGKKALDLLTEYVLKERATGVIVCDGPRPPGRVARFGIVLLARKTGYPILKIRSWGERQYTFWKSWCRFLIVFPFSRVVIWSDPPLFVPADTRAQALEGIRLEIEKRLNEMADVSEGYLKRPAALLAKIGKD